jgi:hypothetical protein
MCVALHAHLSAQSVGTLQDISPGRIGATGQIDPDNIYMFGGVDSLGNYLNSADWHAYCFSCPSWNPRLPMPTPRAYAASALLNNGNILVIGGENSLGPSNAVEEFSPVLNSWTPRTPLPFAITHAKAVIANGMVHLFGGYDGSTVLNTHLIYNPSNQSWTTGQALPIGIMDHGVATVRNGGIDDIIVMGGRTVPGSNASISAAVFRFNGGNGPVINMAPMTRPRANFGCAGENLVFRRVYAYGGYLADGSITDQIDILSTTFNNWTNFTSNLLNPPKADFWGDGFWDASTVCAYRLLAIGGIEPGGNYSVSSDQYYVQSGPLSLSDMVFHAQQSNAGTMLKWSVEQPSSFSHFTLERSYQGVEYEMLAEKITAGDGPAWEYRDTEPSEPGLYTYRMQVYGWNNEWMDSRETMVMVTEDLQAGLKIFPNPTDGQLNIGLPGEPQSHLLRVLRLDGSEAMHIQTPEQAVVRLDLSGLTSGLYIVETEVAGQLVHAKVVVD